MMKRSAHIYTLKPAFRLMLQFYREPNKGECPRPPDRKWRPRELFEPHSFTELVEQDSIAEIQVMRGRGFPFELVEGFVSPHHHTCQVCHRVAHRVEA